MSNGGTLSRKSVRRALRVHHPDWKSILHDVKKAYLANTVPLSFYNQFHQQLSILLEKRPREDGDDDEDEEEREEQAKRPRTDDGDNDDDNDAGDEPSVGGKDDEDPKLPTEILVVLFSAMPWYQICISRDISAWFRSVIDKHVLRTIREIVIDDEDPGQMATEYNLPMLLMALMKNPALPGNAITKLVVSRTVYDTDLVEPNSSPRDLLTNAVVATFNKHRLSLRELSLRGLIIAETARSDGHGRYSPFVFFVMPRAKVRVLDLKPYTFYHGRGYIGDLLPRFAPNMRDMHTLREIRMPYAYAHTRDFCITSSQWSFFPTAPGKVPLGFTSPTVDPMLIRQWTSDVEGGDDFRLKPNVVSLATHLPNPIINSDVAHIHFYSMDIPISVEHNVNILARTMMGLPLDSTDFMLEPQPLYFPNQQMFFPNARSVVFDGPCTRGWKTSADKLPLVLGDECEIFTCVANTCVTLDPTLFVGKLKRVCIFDSFAGNAVPPLGAISVTHLVTLWPEITQLYVQRSQAFSLPADDDIDSAITMYHVGPTPIDAMKNVDYDIISELRAAARSSYSADDPYMIEINECSKIGVDTTNRPYVPYDAVGHFVNLEQVSIWWTDPSDRGNGLSDPTTLVGGLEDLTYVSTICIVDGETWFQACLDAVGGREREFILLRSHVEELPPTIDDATMRTQKCHLWPVDPDTIHNMVQIAYAPHPMTKINGISIEQWGDWMDIDE